MIPLLCQKDKCKLKLSLELKTGDIIFIRVVAKNVRVCVDASGHGPKVVDGLHDHFVGRIKRHDFVRVDGVFVMIVQARVVAHLVLRAKSLLDPVVKWFHMCLLEHGTDRISPQPVRCREYNQRPHH